jgi:arsenate reductase-like glutaredoxin family protein
MTCWRCGVDVSEGNVECDSCANVTTTFTNAGVRYRKVDFSKVTTLEELLTILSEFGFGVVEGSLAYDKLREFLS